ncbi:hypothetical protein ACFLQR_04710 [Verrucomicrobiota bacterium]
MNDHTKFPAKLRLLLMRLCLVAVAGIFSLILLELFLRFFASQELIVPMPAQADKELIYTMPPNTKAYLKGTSTRWFHLNINSLGLRDREHDFSKKPGVFRVMLLGDSMSMAEGAELEETYIKQFEEMANQHSPTQIIETINAAVRGYGNDQEVLFFERVGPKFHPDLVILGFYEENDFADNRRGGIFRLDGDKLVQTIPTKQNSSKLMYYSSQIRIQNFPGYRFLVGHSHLVNLLRKRVAHYLSHASFRVDRAEPAAKPGISESDWKLTLKILERWVADCRQAGAIPLILFIPSKENVLDLKAGKLAQSMRADLRLREFALARDILWINLLEPFAQSSKPERLYLTEGHLSPEGHKKVAEEILGYLVDPEEVLNKLVTPARDNSSRVGQGR